MATFPAAIPSYLGFTATHTLAADQHAAQHNQEQADIAAIATKLGTGAATPGNNTVLRGNGAGTTTYDQVHAATDISGILPVVNGGTGQNSLSALPLASPAISGTVSGGASYSSPILITPTIADLTNANHNHSNAAGGGQLNGANAISNDSITGAQINFAATGVDAGIWWEELGRTTLGVAGDRITVNITPRKYIKIYGSMLPSGNIIPVLVFNNDTAANYAHRYTISNTVGSNVPNSINIGDFGPAGALVVSMYGEIVNIANTQKVGWFKGVSANNSAATVPDYVEFYAKWVNTSVQISRLDVINTSTGDFAIGSELIVLGHD